MLLRESTFQHQVLQTTKLASESRQITVKISLWLVLQLNVASEGHSPRTCALIVALLPQLSRGMQEPNGIRQALLAAPPFQTIYVEDMMCRADCLEWQVGPGCKLRQPTLPFPEQ